VEAVTAVDSVEGSAAAAGKRMIEMWMLQVQWQVAVQELQFPPELLV